MINLFYLTVKYTIIEVMQIVRFFLIFFLLLMTLLESGQNISTTVDAELNIEKVEEVEDFRHSIKLSKFQNLITIDNKFNYLKISFFCLFLFLFFEFGIIQNLFSIDNSSPRASP